MKEIIPHIIRLCIVFVISICFKLDYYFYDINNFILSIIFTAIGLILVDVYALYSYINADTFFSRYKKHKEGN